VFLCWKKENTKALWQMKTLWQHNEKLMKLYDGLRSHISQHCCLFTKSCNSKVIKVDPNSLVFCEWSPKHHIHDINQIAHHQSDACLCLTNSSSGNWLQLPLMDISLMPTALVTGAKEVIIFRLSRNLWSHGSLEFCNSCHWLLIFLRRWFLGKFLSINTEWRPGMTCFAV